MSITRTATGLSISVQQSEDGSSKIGIVATSDASGDRVATVGCRGACQRMVIENDGADTPTTLWDLVITDEHGTTVFSDTAISIAADTEYSDADFSPNQFNGNLTFTFANMGDSNIATVTLYFTP